jgi:membrane-bound lytic murein transglycosylase F
LLKSQPKYYQDEVCEQGYLRGEETEQFVSEVWSRYKYIISKGIK